MSTVQLPGSNRFDSQMQMYTGKQKYDVSLAKELQHFPTKKKNRKNGIIDQYKYKKRYMKRKWTYRQYHVQDSSDVENQYLKTYCKTNQFQ